MTIISYAQNYEDVLLNRVFGGQQVGFYVDVGAYHPVDGSVTKLFYDRGWSGINVEPGSMFELLAVQRPRDTNLRMAVLDHAGETPFLEIASDAGMSHIVERDVGCSVPCETLEAIVENHGMGRPVDFVKIDAEGAEAAIVRSTDWRRLRPRVIVIEATKPWSNVLANESWEPDLLSMNYVRAYFDGINCFYVPEEEWALLQHHFRVPVNVLDSVVTLAHYTALGRVAAVEGNLSRAEAELAAVKKKLIGTEAELAAVKGKLIGTEAELAAAQGILTRTEAALAAAQRALADTQAQLADLKGTHDQAMNAAAMVYQELEAARTELSRHKTCLQELTTPPQPAPAIAPPVESRRPLHRQIARWCYGLVRPVVRPVSWRARAFLTGPLLTEIGIIRDGLNQIAQPQAATQLEHIAEFQARSLGQLDQLKQLAKAIEDIVLTLAIAPAHQLAGDGAPGASNERGARRVLRLPRGRHADIEVGAADLSVAAALDSSDGEWEPHVRRYFESVVKPDWVCMDIGANLGAHSLSLAVLAHKGRVIAFEADPVNHALLTRNAVALPQPKANIEPVQVALWDSPGDLTIGGAEELAGCAFVVCGATEATSIEQRLRVVVDPTAVGDVELHVRLARVAGVRLDGWVFDHPLPRLDLIKLDVEGAEAHVIRGADQTLQRLRPRLLVEYNPACAATYFGQPANALYDELVKRFAAIHAIEPDGSLAPIPDWAALEVRLAAGKGWEDLLCMPGVEATVGTVQD